jgi:hypothetical protein
MVWGSPLDSHLNGRAVVAALNEGEASLWHAHFLLRAALNLSYGQGPLSLGSAIRMGSRYRNDFRRIS